MFIDKKVRFRASIGVGIIAILCYSASARASGPIPEDGFAFFVAADMREYAGVKYHGPGYFLSACEAMKPLGGDFLVSPGDIDPPQPVRDVISRVFGPEFPWYPGIGNHDLGKADLAWIRRYNHSEASLPGIVRKGPPGVEETMYAFDHGNAHFVVINEYFDGKSDHASGGDIGDAVFSWLNEDLAENLKPFVFVFGHEPAYPLPDMDTGKERHEETSLNRNLNHRDRMWKLLAQRRVTAFICGHTHTASAKKIDGVWQLDTGHARGKGDTSIPSSFLRIVVTVDEARYEIYRTDGKGVDYRLRLSASLTKD